MIHLKIFEETIDTWDKHPKFDDAVKIVTKALKDKKVGGVNWVSKLLGYGYPQSTSFARRVVIVANKNLTKDQ